MAGGWYVSGIEAATLLTADPTTPGMARHFVRDVLESADIDAVVIDAVELLTSEVVTNVVVHVGSTSELHVQAVDGSVRVDISDDDDHRPKMTKANVADSHGRGLSIVEALADAWGVNPDPVRGKTVWFELRTRPRVERLAAFTNR